MIGSRRLQIASLIAAGTMLVSVAGPFSAGVMPVTAKGEDTMSLFLSTPWNHRLRQIDPMSLTDMNTGLTRLIGPANLWAARPQIFVSPGGDYVSAVYYRTSGNPAGTRDITIRSWDASGARRGPSFHPHALLWFSGLTADGSDLYGFGYRYTANYQSTQSTGFYVIDALDGRTLYHVGLPTTVDNFAYDSNDQRLYVLVDAPWTSGDMPPSPTLYSYDVGSGKQMGSLHLDGVLAGSRVSDDPTNDPVMLMYDPGFALSPDGKQIAILDGSSNVLTTIDAATLTVEKQVSVEQPQSILDRLGALLGIAPTAAEAKEIKGVNLSMIYSPDGASLIVTGDTGKQDSQGRWLPSPLELKRIDVASGEIRAQLATTQTVWDLQFMPDGSALYGIDNSLELDRYDPQSLQVMASRPLDQDSEMYMLNE